jgi:hypothetical protein
MIILLDADVTGGCDWPEPEPWIAVLSSIAKVRLEPSFAVRVTLF